MSIKTICAGIGTLALIGGLAACGSAGAGGGGSAPATSGRSPYAQGLAFDSGDPASLISIGALNDWIGTNDPYGTSTQDGQQWALGAEVAYEQRIMPGNPTGDSGVTVTSAVVDQTTLTVNGSGIVFQAVLTFSNGSSGTYTISDPLTGWESATFGDGYSWTPVTAAATQVTDPNGDTCSSLDANGYCYADDPANTATPTPAPTVTQTVTQAPPAVNTDPWSVVSEYYSLIESDQYQAAWNLQSPAFQGQESNFTAWMNGYANTGEQTLTEISESGDKVYVNLSAVDTATSATQTFTGWFTVDSGLITSGSMTQTG